MLKFGPFDLEKYKSFFKKWLQCEEKYAILIMKLYRLSITMPFRRGSYVSGFHEHENPKRTGYVLWRRVKK